MAFAVKYRMEWSDILGGSEVYKLDILLEGYTTPVIDIGHTIDGFVKNYNSGGGDWVRGSEIIFTFVVNEDDLAAYDADFYQSGYKNLKAKFYIDGVLDGVYWIKPENTLREYNLPEVTYSVSGTDGLNDLGDIDYDGYLSQGIESLLQVIKNAVEFGGIDDLDFFIQMNIFEDVLSTSALENIFPTLYTQNRALSDVTNGEIKPNKCNKVIEKMVKSFYSMFYQSGGYWKITNFAEYVSEKDTFDYATLAAVDIDVAHDREVDISAYHRPAGSPFEKSSQPIAKTLRLIFLNKNLGTPSGLLNGDFDSGTTNWNNGAGGAAWNEFAAAGGILNLREGEFGGDAGVRKVFYSDDFNITDVGNADGFFYFEIQLDLQESNLVYNTGNYVDNPPYFTVTITYPVRGAVTTNFIQLQKGLSVYVPENPELFPFDELNLHSLEIAYEIPYTGLIDTIGIAVYDINLIIVGATYNSFDSLSVYTLSGEGHKEIEEKLYIADAIHLTDIGAIFDSGQTILTTSWTRYGIGTTFEGSSLIDLFAQQYLNDRRVSHDVMGVELYDIDEELQFDSILTLAGKSYRFMEFSKNYKTKLVTGTVVQIDNGL